MIQFWWVNKGDRQISLKSGKTERGRERNSAGDGQPSSGPHFWGRLCLNQGYEAPVGAAWPQECAPVVSRRVINQSWRRPCRCSAVPLLTHTRSRERQWWIGKRSDSLGVADSPHLHNKLHDLISLCCPLFSFLTRAFSSFDLYQPRLSGSQTCT